MRRLFWYIKLKGGVAYMAGDLHCHSVMSDGAMDIDTLVRYAALKDLEYMALSDHDTIAGVETAVKCGEKYGVNVIKAIEISSYDFKRLRKVHILCYNYKNPEPLFPIINKNLEDRNRFGERAIETLLQYYIFDKNDVYAKSNKSTAIFKQHIMHTLMEYGYTDTIFGDLFAKLFKKGGLIREKTNYPNVFDVVAAAKKTGGAVILAHPPVYNSFDLIPELIECGIDGLEVNHPRCSQQDKDYLIRICKENNLIITGGTDFHGFYGGKIYPLGTCTADNIEIEKILNF